MKLSLDSDGPQPKSTQWSRIVPWISPFLLTLLALHYLYVSLVDSSRNVAKSFESIISSSHSSDADDESFPPYDANFIELLEAVDVMQDDYFEVWQGTWPLGIDWTDAVVGTHLSAVLITLSKAFEYSATSLSESAHSLRIKAQENLINRFFTQLTAFYYGQDAFAIRTEANDDMLWVTLGWLESIKFINLYSKTHYGVPDMADQILASGSPNMTYDTQWYGNQWIPAFAHRARIFWELASHGWNTTLCGGGMIWNNNLAPYKNAITNELFISASISMYLYYPGDSNTSPFSLPHNPSSNDTKDGPGFPHDPKYLKAAVEGYKWLITSNMTNTQGLFVDGFHITNWNNATCPGYKCDDRNEMVYTYNQGVLLTGQRGLYLSTAARSYLSDGHDLIRSVIAATGWSLSSNAPYPSHGVPKSHGLGRLGTLEEACDPVGSCNQDSQTFKGIFFHHLSHFCEPLPLIFVKPDGSSWESDVSEEESRNVKKWHSKNCKSYNEWIEHNARAALETRDKDGKFGMWWGVPDRNFSAFDLLAAVEEEQRVPEGALDYRNEGWPEEWLRQAEEVSKTDPARFGKPMMPERQMHFGVKDGAKGSLAPASSGKDTKQKVIGRPSKDADPNNRGRGRTVETQSGGVAVLRAVQELVVFQGGWED